MLSRLGLAPWEAHLCGEVWSILQALRQQGTFCRAALWLPRALCVSWASSQPSSLASSASSFQVHGFKCLLLGMWRDLNHSTTSPSQESFWSKGVYCGPLCGEGTNCMWQMLLALLSALLEECCDKGNRRNYKVHNIQAHLLIRWQCILSSNAKL